MAQEHLEVERKYAVPAGAELPDLGAAVAEDREHDLEAVYLDTADHALLGRGITLRRRTGGHDAGWHLKVPAAGQGRRELHHPLGEDGRVPAALVDAVRAVVRDHELVPVAVVRNRRRELRLVDDQGRDLATVSDDRVVATADPVGDDGVWEHWREWEVELAEGRPVELLDQLEGHVLAVGARPSGSTSKLAHVLGREVGDPPAHGSAPPAGSAAAVLHGRLAELVATLLEQDAAVRDDRPDGVHQMRVACRQLRSVLSTGRPLLAPGATDHLRGELRLLGQVLGRARDAEVMEERLVRSVRQEPSELVLGPVVARIESELHRERGRAMVRVQETLRSARYFRLLDALDDLVRDLPVDGRGADGARDTLARLLRKDAGRVRDAVRAVGAAAPVDRDTALHELRKKVKRLRYAAELAEPVGGHGARRLRRRAKALQQELGEHQDSVVARGRLRQLAVQAHLARENGFTFGLLAGTERLRAERAERAAEVAWDRLPGPRRVRAWVRNG